MVEDTMTLQLHISDKCNLRCMHCYQENKEYSEIEFDNLVKILKQYKEFLKSINMRGHINLTGGEPLCNKNFYKLLEYMNLDKEYYSFAILTNGTLITDEVAKKISKFNPTYVQISIDGGKKVHEEIRGKGTFEKAISGIKNLKRYGIYTSISFTAHKKNYKEFSKVVKIGLKAKVNRIWTDRFIPIGGANHLKELVLSKEETKEFFYAIRNEKDKAEDRNKNTEISMHRALQFLECDSKNIYSCTAGTSLITIMENGDLVPCRRMPIVLGNVLEEGNTIKSIYEKSNIIKELKKKNIPKECTECEYGVLCRGGLKCLGYAFKESLIEKDLGCYFEY